MKNSFVHNFHIPVLGLGFSIDTPLKVAKFGISSVISIVDDILIEKVREYYNNKYNLEYIPIFNKDIDSRAKRITAYLDMVDDIVKEQFENLKRSPFTIGDELSKYFEMLPDFSDLKIKYNEMLHSSDENIIQKIQKWLRENMKCGRIDVNIMTKVNKVNYSPDGKALPVEFNDAHAALRGFALSKLNSSIIFSAGMNSKLFSYLETFNDFYPQSDGSFKKNIILKVSDFRSATIQGKYLAKKGLWVSEYRIESGLNCGGHAFPTEGLLLGPILEEFNNNREELFKSVHELYLQSLDRKHINFDTDRLNFDVTVQGGIGKSTEQEFLMRRYNLKSAGWGSPFLLVPEVMNVDNTTLEKLGAATENDLYLSEVSPLGVSFNNLRNNSKDIEKLEKIKKEKPGSPCIKKFLISNTEFSEKPLCLASNVYLRKKIKDLKTKFLNIDEFNIEFNKLVDKVCLCEGLAASVLLVKNIGNPKQNSSVSVCPGPNLAYFSNIVSLKEMVDHIYGRINLITNPNRPNMFIKELSLYIEYFIKKVEVSFKAHSQHSETSLKTFYSNLKTGIEYYKKLIPEMKEETILMREKMMEELKSYEKRFISFSSIYVL